MLLTQGSVADRKQLHFFLSCHSNKFCHLSFLALDIFSSHPIAFWSLSCNQMVSFVDLYSYMGLKALSHVQCRCDLCWTLAGTRGRRNTTVLSYILPIILLLDGFSRAGRKRLMNRENGGKAFSPVPICGTFLACW